MTKDFRCICNNSWGSGSPTDILRDNEGFRGVVDINGERIQHDEDMRSI